MRPKRMVWRPLRGTSSTSVSYTHLHGVVAWIGGGQVWGTDKFRWDNTLYSFGCGYRFEFKNRMNIRLDYGWGVYGNQNLPWDRKRSSAFLFTASEAF